MGVWQPTAVLAITFRVVLALALIAVTGSRPILVASAPTVPAPVEEENEEEQSDTDGETKDVPSARAGRVLDPNPVPIRLPSAPPVVQLPAVVLPRAARHDPFRNGLGTPIRC